MARKAPPLIGGAKKPLKAADKQPLPPSKNFPKKGKPPPPSAKRLPPVADETPPLSAPHTPSQLSSQPKSSTPPPPPPKLDKKGKKKKKKEKHTGASTEEDVGRHQERKGAPAAQKADLMVGGRAPDGKAKDKPKNAGSGTPDRGKKERPKKDKADKNDKRKHKKSRKGREKTEYRLAEGALIEKNGDCSYLVVKKLGKGAFAAVYEATRSSDRANVAIKVEFFDRKKEHRIPQECQVYKEIEVLRKINPADPNVSHFLRFFDHLQNELAEFLILQRAGESIDSICTKHAPTFNTGVQWALQALSSLEHLHLLGCIHRDIKSANFIVSEDRHTLFLIDFGMAVKFIRDPNKMPKTSVYEFIGTAKYAPRTAHNGMPQARRDDVESWLYLSMEFFKLDILPWRSSKSQKILNKKQQFIEGTAYRELFRILPRGYYAMVGVIRETTVMEEPNYDFFYEVLRWIAAENGVDLNASFEWHYVGKKGSAKRADHDLQKANHPQKTPPPLQDMKKEQKAINSVLRHSKHDQPVFPEAKPVGRALGGRSPNKPEM